MTGTELNFGPVSCTVLVVYRVGYSIGQYVTEHGRALASLSLV